MTRTLDTPRLLIRPLEASDISVLTAIWADAEVTRYMGGPRDTERVRRGLEEELQAGSHDPIRFWPVIEKASGRVVGHCGLTRKDVDGRAEIELVYVFAADVWGKGYATEAASTIWDHAFRHLGVTRLVALVDPANVASIRVAEKIGMQFEREVTRPGGALRRVYAVQVGSS